MDKALNSLKHYIQSEQEILNDLNKDKNKDKDKDEDKDNKINKKRNTKMPDISTLKLMIQQCSYEEVGRVYGVSGKAVRKWCDKYNLVTSKELNKHFDTFIDAANWLHNNYFKGTGLKNLAYRISKAKKDKTMACNFHWE